MSRSTPSFVRRAAYAGALALSACLASGCTVITVAGAVGGLAVSGAGLAIDAGVGAVKLTGQAVGATAGAVLPGGD